MTQERDKKILKLYEQESEKYTLKINMKLYLQYGLQFHNTYYS